MLEMMLRIVNVFFVTLFAYQVFYVLVSLLARKRKTEKAVHMHRIAVLICARNEDAVIGDLLDCLASQTYPQDAYRVFVMADNCTDHTAEAAAAKGAAVYRRYNTRLVGKGYALEELFQNIRRDYGSCHEAFLIFDADNLVRHDYLEQMNRVLCQGARIVTGYRASKNYDTNWLSAGSSLWFMRECRYLNRARDLLGLSCAVSGTGFMFRRDVLAEWHYHALTEDLEFNADQIAAGETIRYCEEAVLYDEQPVELRQSLRQRLRWSKGILQVLGSRSISLLKGIGKGSFACFDYLWTLGGAYVLAMVSLLLQGMMLICAFMKGSGMAAAVMNMMNGILRGYACFFGMGLLTTVTEWKRIDTNAFRKLLYVFTFPLFMATYLPVACAALFTNVSWTPISHTVTGIKRSAVLR